MHYDNVGFLKRQLHDDTYKYEIKTYIFVDGEVYLLRTPRGNETRRFKSERQINLYKALMCRKGITWFARIPQKKKANRRLWKLCQ